MARAKKGTPPGMKGKVPGSRTSTSSAAKGSGLNAGNTPVQMASPRRGGYPKASQADVSGISAKLRRGDPGADAGDKVRGRGRAIDGDAAAAATGHSKVEGYGIKSGSSRDDHRGRNEKESRGVGGESDGAREVAFGKKTGGTMRSGTKGGTGVTAQGLGDNYVPGHTFASSTIPRSSQMSSPRRSDNDADDTNDGGMNPDGADQMKQKTAKNKQASEVSLQAAAPSRSREMADGGGMIRASRKGVFTAKAKSAGMGVQEYARHVLGAKKGTFDPATVKQANFARNFGGGAQK